MTAMKMISCCRSQSNLKSFKKKNIWCSLNKDLEIQEAERMIRKMRIEFVKRDFTPVQNQPITKQLTGDSNLSKTEAIKIFGNQSNGFSEIYGDDESEEEDYYSDPYEKLVASRKSPERANAFENLLEYTNSSTQNPELLKTVKIAAYDMESEDSKGMRKNTYYRPPRRIVYNISKNFGQSMV